MIGRDTRLLKPLLFGLVLIVFVGMFLVPGEAPWPTRYARFGVPAFAYPGGDARNIQMAAHCARTAQPYLGDSACMAEASLFLGREPQVSVPMLNYPSWWVRAYAFFGDDSERFFMRFWLLNALLLVATVALCCWHYQQLALPFFLFSPVTLLTMERGNIEGITFFVTFVPLLVWPRVRVLHGLALGLAAALKVFPLFGAVAFLRRRVPFLDRPAGWGLLLSLPLIAVSLMELPEMVKVTQQAFKASYGFLTLQHAPFIEGHPKVAVLVTLVAVVLCLAALWQRLRTPAVTDSVDADLSALSPADLTVLMVSAGIFVLTFLGFSNWAYRLIFLMPAALVVSRGRSATARQAFWGVLLVPWLALLPQGLNVLNLATFPLFVLMSLLLLRALRWALSR